MNILYVFADAAVEWNSSNWRCSIPAAAINQHTRAHHAQMLWAGDFAANTPTAHTMVRMADIVVVQRNVFDRQIQEAMLRARSYDKIVLADFDDAYHLIPPDNVRYRAWRKGEVAPDRVFRGNMLEQFRLGLSLANGITAPNQLLLDDYASHNQNSRLVPNYWPKEAYKFRGQRRGRPTEEVRIGWGGSLSHVAAWRESGVRPALARAMREDKGIRLVLCGDPRVRELFDYKDLSERIEFVAWTNFEGWVQTLGTFDVGLAPLHGAYDMRRSWIKAIEYGAIGIPWVGTLGEPYREFSVSPSAKLVGAGEAPWQAAIAGACEAVRSNQSNLPERVAHARARAEQFCIEHQAVALVEGLQWTKRHAS